MNKHITSCIVEKNKLVEFVDYVHCKICNFHGSKLASHINLFHKNIDINEYKKINGPLISEKSSDKYSKANIKRGFELKKTFKTKEEAENFYKKRRENRVKNIKVKLNISDEERKRRSDLMKKLNQTTFKSLKIRKIFSETAKKTSARPEIIEKRANILKKWRSENPEKCKEILQKMLAAKPITPTWFSKPEKILFEILKEYKGLEFNFNQVIINEALETKTNRKQIDICDKTKSFYIEFDGPTHFKPIYGIETFENTKKRDLLTEDFILKNNKTLIRISFDQFKDQRKNGGFFKEDCLKKLYYILDSKLKGIYKIGDKYE
jgi:hypothetical protein